MIRPTPRIPLAFFALVLVAAISGCRLARMQPPSALENTGTALEVRSEGGLFAPRLLSFGAWTTQGMARSLTTAHTSLVGSPFLDHTSGRAWQEYGFALADSGRGVAQVDCLTVAGSRGAILGPYSATEGSSVLKCEMSGAAFGRAELLFDMETIGDAGAVRFGGRTLRATSAHHMEGGGVTGESIGFVLMDRGAVIAAVQTMNEPVFWLAPGIDAETATIAAGAAAALVLYQDISHAAEYSG